MCLYICNCIYIYIFICVLIYMQLDIHIYIYIHIYICAYIYICNCTYIYIYLYMCLYICKYIHVYIYIHIYGYIIGHYGSLKSLELFLKLFECVSLFYLQIKTNLRRRGFPNRSINNIIIILHHSMTPNEIGYAYFFII